MDPIPSARRMDFYDAGLPPYDSWSVGHPTLRLKYIDYLVAHLCTNRDRQATVADQKPRPPLGPLRLLELGCNTGKPVTEKLLQDLEPVHVTATDMSATNIYLAKELLGKHGEKVGASASRVDWVEADMMSLVFADADGTKPTNPNLPEISEISEISETPEIPDTPDTPETPETPETLGTLRTPETPETDSPDIPGFDAVVACYSFIYLPRDEQTLLLHRIARWLRPGGVLLANFAEGPRTDAVERWLQDTGWILWSGWGVEGVSDRIRETGMDLILTQVDKDDAHSSYFWVLARKPLEPR